MTKLIDCTIRDGGHLNNWNFSNDCVKQSYIAATEAGADYFEIGYRCDTPQNNWGEFANCNDEFLKDLITPNDCCKIAIMVDAGKCSIDKFADYNTQNTIISLVRVATYPQELKKALELCEGLHKKGYEVFLNLMAVSKYCDEDFNLIRNWKNKNILQSTCFADSFGAFTPDDVVKYKKILNNIGLNKISFHSHNNLQLAFANSIKALEQDFYSIDATIYGMGRGAGNLPAELMTTYLSKMGQTKYNPNAYLNIIENYYIEHMNQTPWGYKLQSIISGLKNIHPYYIDELYKQNPQIDEILIKADLIKKNASISYDFQDLKNILYKND
ncbi:MAG: hypothetical protein R3Y28_08310 [Candidatus Gastranaerophilales bacterium]